MRTYTFVLSVLVHAAAVAGVFLAPLLAATQLPEVRQRTHWIAAAALPTPPRSSPAPRAAASAPTPSVATEPAVTSPVPTSAPDRIEAEPEARPSFFGPVAETPSEAGVPGIGVGTRPGAGDDDWLGSPPVRPVAAPVQRAPERVGGRIKAPAKLMHVPPVYPQLAILSRTEGTVILEAVIGVDGSVKDVKVVRSVRLLDQAAIDAVRQWRFTASTLNDQPVEVLMNVTLQFDLD